MKTPAASYRLAIAVRYWHAARIIIENQIRPIEFMEPTGHLLGMCAELSLKAFLTDRGVSDKELSSRQLGHDLGSCLRWAIERGLEVSELEAKCVLNMREGHQMHFNRYGPKARDGLLQLGAFPAVDEALSLARLAMLIDRVSGDPLKLRERWQHPSNLDWPQTLPLLAYVDLGKLQELERQRNGEMRRLEDLNKQFTAQGIRFSD
ncbi:hypothetical protein J2045_001996 [Peteryoungia aggregata LMG 23059]|uniref:HD domain-containing protein n=1 Tax=Peteryoungia aggregata LMG 23059 TaxID=1368425 RepID=A0ABU0G7P5_9HYPH|nr:hypothetical protein [Peteryoungia aggregata LMG 23059]